MRANNRQINLAALNAALDALLADKRQDVLDAKAAEEARIAETARLALEAGILAVSRGLWRVEIATQVYENYGYRWKPKGGDEYQIAFDHEPTKAEVDEAVRFLSAAVEHKGSNDVLHSYDEYVIAAGVYGPTEETPGEHEIRDMFECGITRAADRDRSLANLRESPAVRVQLQRVVATHLIVFLALTGGFHVPAREEAIAS